MKRRSVIVALLVVTIAGSGTWWASEARAYSANPQAQFGQIACLTTATLVPATSLNGREGIQLCNEGSAAIYFGITTASSCSASGLTTATGTPVKAGACWSGAVSYNKATGTVKVCCIAAANQVAPADTRWLELG
jgi:hypothetical protein